jgi:hypothetical protein
MMVVSVLVLLMGAVAPGLSGTAAASYGTGDALWFSLKPASEDGKTGGRPSGRPSGKPSEKPAGKPEGKPSGRPGGRSGGRPPSRFESEHRPMPLRKYFLNGPHANAQGFVLHPDLTVSELSLELGNNANGSIMLGMADGPHHGANNLYVFDKQVSGETLHVRNAKWVTIQHSCGWGHDEKFNDTRQTSQSLDTIPLEIVVDHIWDTNFHSTVMSGDSINLKVFSYGKPAAGARVTIISEKGWRKTVRTDDLGKASFQMVRDYYPESWSAFHRTEKGMVKFQASYGNDDSGVFEGQNFQDTKYSATFSWRYYPARQEYTSLTVGLLLAVFAMAITGAGIYYYRQRRWRGMEKLAWHE